MSYIKEHIKKLNSGNRKALSIFLTGGFPHKNNFIDLAKSVIDSGADLLEIGIPFSDPLADGPVIQKSSQSALDQGVNIRDILNYVEEIKKQSSIPVILMGYANPINKYGMDIFLKDAVNSGANGLIVPDIPLEEYESFFTVKEPALDVIMLTTPTSSNVRIAKIDEVSSGFVYCVSVTGTTGIRNDFESSSMENLQRAYSIVSKNPMLVGFGISKAEDVKKFAPFCDGVIVGSAVVKLLSKDNYIESASKLINELSEACQN